MASSIASICIPRAHPSLDRNWDPLKRYIAEEQGVDQRDEQTFFDEFDPQALQSQMDMQMQVAAFAKKSKIQRNPSSSLDF